MNQLRKTVDFNIEKLPASWCLVPLGNVVIARSGNSKLIKGKQHAESGFGLFPGFSASGQDVYCESFEHEGEAVIISAVGARCGKCFLAKGKWSSVANTHILFPRQDLIDTKYLWYLVNNEDFWIKSGTAQPFVKVGKSLEILIPIPPLQHQARIVAEIENQFSRLYGAVANLKRVKANLKRYKAAILKAAVEGKLTEEWRHQHPDVEHADKLLERIPAERRKVAGKGKCKEPVGPDTSGLPELPAGWVWVKLGTLPVDVFDGPFGSNLKSSDYVASGVRVIRLENIGSLEFIDGKESFITEQKFEQLKKHTVRHGDIIFSSFVANETRVVMLPDHIEKAINKADCFCIRVRSEAINNRYLETVLATRTAYEQLVAEVHGATRPRINTTHLKDCQIPFPPIKEQIEIVSKISEMMSVVDVAEAQVVANLRRAERLRQSILKQAFTGQLVPQDQSDEPASVLLERIRTNASVGAQHAAPRSAPRTKTARQGRAQHAAPLRKPRPQPEPAPTASDNFACLDDVTAAILGRMQPGREYARADLADPLGLSTGRWNAAIQELKRQRKVRQLGEKRGARYVRV